jgi:hypothetical protein
MTYQFEYFLKEKHAEDYHGIKDHMEGDFERWLADLDGNELMEYAEEALNQVRIDTKEQCRLKLVEAAYSRFLQPDARNEEERINEIFKGI